MFQACYGGVKQEDFQIIYHIILVQANGTKYSPYLADFWGFYWDYRQKKFVCITRGTKNEVISGFWHNIQILSVLQRILEILEEDLAAIIVI